MSATRNSFELFQGPLADRSFRAAHQGKNSVPRFNDLREELSPIRRLAFVALWLFAFAIPWEDAIVIRGFGTSARVLGLIAAGLGVLGVIENGKLRRLAPSHFLMALFVSLAALSYLWSLDPEETLTQVLTYLQLLIMVWLIWELSPRPAEQLRLMQAYVFGTFVSGIGTIYLFLSHQESAYQRYAGAGLNANDLGLMMALSIPFSYNLFIQSRGKILWIYRLQLLLAVTTILLTASRGAALASTVALAIVPLTNGLLTARRKVALLLTATLLVCSGILFVPWSSWERLSTLPTEFAEGTLTGRTVIWKAGWQIFEERPFLGVGANAFRLAASRVLAEPLRFEQPSSAPPAHNTFLSVLVEQGVIGFAVFCALLGSLAFAIDSMSDPSKRLWMTCMAVWVVGVSSLTWEMRKPTWFLFGLLLAQSAARPSCPPRPSRPFLPKNGASIGLLNTKICLPTLN